jgi:hypothetical protein
MHQVKRFPVKPQEYDKIVHIDASATHWSLEHSKHAAAALSALSTFQDMVAAKNQAVTELVKASGVADMNRVLQARLVKDEQGGTFIEVAVHEGPLPDHMAPPAPPKPPGEEFPAAEPAAPAS